MNPNHGVRDARAADLPALAELRGGAVAAAGAGERLLLAEDPAGMPLALARLTPAATGAPVRCWFRVGLAVHAAPALGINHRQRTLLLGNDLADCTEIADLAGTPAALQAVLGAALAIAREAPAQWGTRLFAELPGAVDAAGRSPFWQGLGQHFHDAAPPAHDPAWRSHVAALLPRQVIYASFLDAAAQAAIGSCAAAAEPLHTALQAAGLRWHGQVGIVDGGAVLELHTA